MVFTVSVIPYKLLVFLCGCSLSSWEEFIKVMEEAFWSASRRFQQTIRLSVWVADFNQGYSWLVLRLLFSVPLTCLLLKKNSLGTRQTTSGSMGPR